MSDVELSDVGDDDIVREHEDHDENNEMDQGSDQDVRNVSGDEVMNAEDGENKESSSPQQKKKIVRKMIVLNTERLKGSKGVHTIEKLYEGFKFKGKGHEKQDLDKMMKRLEYWAYRLFPKLEFDDFLAKCEHLGHKKDLQTHLKKYRTGIINSDSYAVDEIVENDNSDDEVLMQTESNVSNENDFERSLDEVETQRNNTFQRLFDDNQQAAEQIQQRNENFQISNNDGVARVTTQTQSNAQLSQQAAKQIQQSNENVQISNNDGLERVTTQTQSNAQLSQQQNVSNQESIIQTQQINKSLQINSEKSNHIIDDAKFEKILSETGQAHGNMVQNQFVNKLMQPDSEKTNKMIDDDDFDILMAETG